MPLEPGQQLSQYRIVEKIGAGGMGEVWKAVDTILDREVAMRNHGAETTVPVVNQLTGCRSLTG